MTKARPYDRQVVEPYLPSADEIRAACLEIQARPEFEKRRRALQCGDRWRVPETSAVDLPDDD